MRRATALLCAALAGLLAVFGASLAAPALSLDPYAPRAVDFAMPVDAPSRARAAGGGVVSPVLRAPKRFDLVGVRWSGDAEPRVRLRVRRAGEAWSRWVTAAHAHDHGPDSGRRAGEGTDPVWTGGADEIQLRLSRRVRGLRLQFVNSTGTATAADRARTAVRRAVRSAFAAVARIGVAGAADQPTIVSREEWGADQCTPRDTPSYGRVDMAFVHHTVSANDYGPDDGRAMVLAICRFHRNGNGWDDIGYNFLVDRYGTIYEGRAGGIDQAVVGAQAQGYNAVSTGVANLGTHDTAPQSDAALTAIARLLAWKLPLHGSPVEGEVTVTSAGGSANRYPAGREVTFQRISGHRDGDHTACPGQALYDQLPRLREMTAGRAPHVPLQPRPDLTLETPDGPVGFRAPAALRGRFTGADGRGVPGARIVVEALGTRGFRRLAAATTDADGAWALTLRSAWSRVLRAREGGRKAGTVSKRDALTVTPALSARTDRRVRAGRRAVVTGRVRPTKPSIRVAVARQDASGRYRYVETVRGRVQRGRFRVPVRLVRPGLYRLRVIVRSDRRNAGVSGDLHLRAVRNGADDHGRRVGFRTGVPEETGADGSGGGVQAGR